jgi:phage gp46-like protein
MPDIRIAQSGGPFAAVPSYAVRLDWLLTPQGLDETQALATAVIVALGTDRLALQDDVLPDPLVNDRRGWWGDLEADSIWSGWPIGSRLWEMARDKITGANAKVGATTAKAYAFILEAIQPFKDNGLVSDFTIEVTQPSPSRISATITLLRERSPAIALVFQDLWDELTA